MSSGAEPGMMRGHWRAARLNGAVAGPVRTPLRVRVISGRASSRAPALAWIAKTDTRLYRAYLLKEVLRHVFSVKGEEGKRPWTGGSPGAALPHPVFVELAGRIVRHRQAIDAALDHGLSQGLIESSNTKIRLLTRIAFGFRSPEALIALAMLALGGHPTRPARTNQTPTDHSVGPLILVFLRYFPVFG